MWVRIVVYPKEQRGREEQQSVYLKTQPRLCQAREEMTYKPNRTPYYLNAKRPPITSKVIKKIKALCESRWRRNRTGDHFLFYKFIERTTER